jgi:beta-lactamase class C
MKLKFILPLCAATLLISAAGADTPTPNDKDFDSAFRHILDEHGVPGGAYAIVHDGRIVRASGHGVRMLGGDEPVTADTVFRVASVSKTFAAQITALLVQESKLNWDDALIRFLPDFRFKRNGHAEALQIRHLLGQSTGIVPNAYDNLLEADMPLEKILPRFRELDPLCAPGACYTYQNILFGLIDPVVEQATSLSYSTLVQERLFKPLEMQHASLGMEAFLAAENRALPHVRRRGEWQPAEIQPGYYQVAPAAGINASANDLGNWLIAQLGYRPDIVPPQLVEQLTQKHVRTPRDLRRRHWRDMLTDAHYGMGWRIYDLGGEEIYLHSGWVNGYVADVAYSRNRRTGLVVLLNAESGAISEITTTFWRDVLNGGSLLGHLHAAADDAHESATESAGELHPQGAGTLLEKAR